MRKLFAFLPALWLLAFILPAQFTVPTHNGSQSVAPVAPTLCSEMTKQTIIYPPGYALFDMVVGQSSNYVYYLRFRPSKSGTVYTFKWMNSSGSHAIWDSCTAHYGAIEPCADQGGKPEYIHTGNPDYILTFPSGWWPYADTCSSSHSGCYAAGTGGIISLTLENGAGTALATATINQPNVTYGFYHTFPVVNWSTPVSLIANTYYYVKIQDTDPDRTNNWFSFDSYTPYSKFNAVTINGKNMVLVTLGPTANADDAIYQQTSLGGPTATNFQPIFAMGFADATCVTQGFAH